MRASRGPRRRASSWLLGAALGLVPALAGGASFVIWASDDGEVRSATPAGTVAGRDVDQWGLDGHGFGPVTFGTSVTTLVAAGVDVREDLLCEGSATVAAAPFDTYLTVRAGHVLNALVKNPAVPIAGNVQVGQSLADVRARFPDAHRVEQPTGDAWVVRDAAPGVLAFFVDRGTVIGVRGAPEVSLVFETVSCD